MLEQRCVEDMKDDGCWGPGMRNTDLGDILMHINNAKNVIIQVNLSCYKWGGDQVVRHFASLSFPTAAGLVVIWLFFWT